MYMCYLLYSHVYICICLFREKHAIVHARRINVGHCQILEFTVWAVQKPVLNTKNIVRRDFHRILHCIIERRVHDWHVELKLVLGALLGVRLKKCRKPAQGPVVRLFFAAQPDHVFNAEPFLNVFAFFKNACAVNHSALPRIPSGICKRHVDHACIVILHRSWVEVTVWIFWIVWIVWTVWIVWSVRAFGDLKHPALIVLKPKHALAPFGDHRINIR